MAIVVGNVIGSGIFAKPGRIAADCGYFPMIITGWIVAGIICLFGAICFAELAAMMPRAGGLYVFLREAFGKQMAFLFGLNEYVFGRTATNGALATFFASLCLGMITPAGTSINPWVKAILACLVIILLAGINVLGVIWGGRVQSATTLVKAGFLGLVAVVPFLLGAVQPQTIQLANYATVIANPAQTTIAAQFAAILLSIMWAYNGWHDIAPVAEEVRNPQRNIPLALIGGTVTLIVLYVGANLAYHGVLSMSEIAAAEGNTAGVMIHKVLLPWGSGLAALGSAGITAVTMCSVFGALNCNLMLGPRIAFAMARDGIFWRPLAHVHESYRTPAVSIVAQSSVSCLFILVVTFLIVNVPSIRDTKRDIFDLLTNFVTFSANIFYSLCVLGVYVLRKKHPEWERPYKTWGYPYVPAIFLAAMSWFLWMAFFADPQASQVGLGLMLAGIPVYYLVTWWRPDPSLPDPGVGRS